MPNLDAFPLPFWLALAVLVTGAYWTWQERRLGWGLPALMVLGTVTFWYIGDVFYNDYASYREKIGDPSLDSAWWQFLWFLIVFIGLVKPVHLWVNRALRGRRSYLIHYFETNRLEHTEIQRRISQVAGGLFIAWILLMGVALVRVQGDVLGLFAPYFGHKAQPWKRGQIGGGYSALLSLAHYLQIFLVASIGVVVAISRNPRTRRTALVIFLLTIPWYIFDRTRNTMLSTILPGLLAWIFLRLRGGVLMKVGVLIGVFVIVNFWFSIVIANRTGMSFDITGALSGNRPEEKARHEGLNMFEELAWIDRFIETGVYLPNYGQRYLAELVNPIPRGLWKDKPTIGLDYAVARGQRVVGPNGEVSATVATGMIGQGVVNFGRFFGPMASALLMSLWVAVLARQDLLGSDPARLLLYGSGLILTFNLGRGITLLVLYPFLIGTGLHWIWQKVRYHSQAPPRKRWYGHRRPRGWHTREGMGAKR